MRINRRWKRPSGNLWNSCRSLTKIGLNWLSACKGLWLYASEWATANFYDRILYSISSLWIVNADQTGYLIIWAFGKLWAAFPIAYGGFIWPVWPGMWSNWGLPCIMNTPTPLFRMASSDCCRTYSTQQAQTLLQLWLPPPLPPPFWSLRPIAPTTPLSISWSNQPTKFALDLAHLHLPNILQF